jgi:hypothetical protein
MDLWTDLFWEFQRRQFPQQAFQRRSEGVLATALTAALPPAPSRLVTREFSSA